MKTIYVNIRNNHVYHCICTVVIIIDVDSCDDNNNGAVIGAVVGVLCAVIIIMVITNIIMWLYCFRKRCHTGIIILTNACKVKNDMCMYEHVYIIINTHTYVPYRVLLLQKKNTQAIICDCLGKNSLCSYMLHM